MFQRKVRHALERISDLSEEAYRDRRYLMALVYEEAMEIVPALFNHHSLLAITIQRKIRNSIDVSEEQAWRHVEIACNDTSILFEFA